MSSKIKKLRFFDRFSKRNSCLSGNFPHKVQAISVMFGAH